jgi:hypothetical protein
MNPSGMNGTFDDQPGFKVGVTFRQAALQRPGSKTPLPSLFMHRHMPM